MKVFLVGTVTANLAPAWIRTAKKGNVSLEAFKEELINENF